MIDRATEIAFLARLLTEAKTDVSGKWISKVHLTNKLEKLVKESENVGISNSIHQRFSPSY